MPPDEKEKGIGMKKKKESGFVGHGDAKKMAGMKKKEGYEFIEHTADIMARSWGEDFPSALMQASLAMFSVLGKAKPVESFEVSEKAGKKEELVNYFLASVLAECEIREILPAKAEVLEYSEKKGEFSIRAKIFGEKKRRRDDIKAVTHHELKVEEKKGECKITVLFDV